MTAAGKCPHCLWLSVRPRTGTGRTMPYRVFDDLALPDDLPIPTCGGCGATYFDAATTTELSPTLTKQYNKRLLALARAALVSLKPHVSQKELELLTGLSHGYLSSVKQVCVSAPLVALLMLMAESPTAQLAALRRCWASAWNEGSEHDRTDGHKQLADGRKAGERRTGQRREARSPANGPAHSPEAK